MQPYMIEEHSSTQPRAIFSGSLDAFTRNSPAVFANTVASLFCGAGGLDLGFKNEDFDLVYACDNDPAAIDCYRRNIDPRAYVRDVTSPAFKEELSALSNCDVLLGGFPCQGFSKAGPKRNTDSRIPLYREMVEVTKRLAPRLILAENVDGLSQNFDGLYLDAIIRDFEAIGYRIDYRIIDAVAFGVPQHRRRIFFVGVRSDIKDSFSWPEPPHAVKTRNGDFKIAHLPLLEKDPDTLLPGRTIADAIHDLVNLDAPVSDHVVNKDWPAEYELVMSRIGEGQKLCNVRHAKTSVYTWRIPEVFGAVDDAERTVLETISKHRRHKKYGDIPNGNPLPISEIEHLSGLKDISGVITGLLQKGYLKEVGGMYDLKGAMFCSGLFKRPLWRSPSPTVLTNFDNPRYFIHPLRARPFSVRECARLQGFPDEFKFLGAEVDVKSAYRLIGNAVAPPVAQAFARSVKKFLSNVDRKVVWREAAGY